jgi:hypothetical protein
LGHESISWGARENEKLTTMLMSLPERPEVLGNTRSMMTGLRDTELIGDD